VELLELVLVVREGRFAVPPTIELVDTPDRESSRQSSWRSRTQHVTILLGVSVCYFACAKAGLLLASINPSATPIWPATGLALSAVLLLGYRIFPAILFGAFLANATTASSLAISAAIAIGNTLECLVGAWLINRWSSGTATFNTSGGVARFVFISMSAAAPGADQPLAATKSRGFRGHME